MATGSSSSVRHSVIAGSWYPGNAKQLCAMIDEFLNNVPPQRLEGDLVGLIAPHAGYIYSGQVAAYAYALLRGKPFSKVVIVSPVHRIYPGRFAVTDKAFYETPLGLVPVDTELLQAIEQHITLNRVSQDMEHSLEIQLPFLQHVLGNFALTPIMMGEQDWESAMELGQALAKAIGKEPVLLVASTDLSHFHRYDIAVRLDQLVLDHITAYDPEGLARTLAMQKAEACGGGPVMAVMVAAQKLGANRAVLLKYMNSGDVTGDRSSVVGYAAVALLRQ
ncbi:MAG: AmmeMemoRadiSam system protein B [Chloroflexi bacterium]|nr:AmmeMemoRadiSam system protein B [Chloroflexota bacterium]